MDTEQLEELNSEEMKAVLAKELEEQKANNRKSDRRLYHTWKPWDGKKKPKYRIN